MPIPTRLVSATSAADVRFNGDRPWDLQVHNPQLYPALLRHGSLALGDGYVRGDWDCERIDELICRLLRANAQRPLSKWAWLTDAATQLREQLGNPQGPAGAFNVGERHYDIDPRVYAAMLDPEMTYSCGYWRQVPGVNYVGGSRQLRRRVGLLPPPCHGRGVGRGVAGGRLAGN